MAAPDLVTLKLLPGAPRGGCANPAASGGLHWGSRCRCRPSLGSCQVGRAPGGNSSSLSLGKGFSQTAQGAWPGDAAGVYTRSPRTVGKGEGLRSPCYCFHLHLQSWREAVKPAVSTNPSPCRKTQQAQGPQDGHRESSASHTFAAHSQAAGKLPAPTAQHRPRARDSPLAWQEANKEGPKQGNWLDGN